LRIENWSLFKIILLVTDLQMLGEEKGKSNKQKGELKATQQSDSAIENAFCMMKVHGG
jgi:hypothetical protein